FLRQELERLIQQGSGFFQISSHQGQLNSKVDWILVRWILWAPSFDFLARQVVFPVPNVHLDNAVTIRFPRMKWPRSLIHFTGVLEQSDVSQDCAQTVVGLGLI